MIRFIRWMAVAGSVLLLSGCISQRGITTLQETPNAAATLSGLHFRIAAVEQKQGSYAGAGGSVQGLQEMLKKGYPQLFTDELDAIPLSVRFQSATDQQIVGAVVTGLTLGIIPLPAHSGFRMEVGVTPWSESGAALPESSISYIRRDHGWMTIFTPLGLIPIPGRSDMERDTSTILGAETGMVEYAKKQQAFNDLNLQRAVVSALANMDQQALRRYYATRQARMPAFDVDIDGRRYSARLVPAFSQSLQQPGGADQYLLVLKGSEQRDGQLRTTTWQVPVARRAPGGGWELLRQYLMFASKPTVATALLADGQPSRGLVLPVEAPPLADFLDIPVLNPEVAWPVRWSNGILLQIKNTALGNELRGKSLPELQDLTTRLETGLLDLNERVGRANDRAQQAIEKGESPDALRELATVYRQRGEILKAILGAVRQEAAARGAP